MTTLECAKLRPLVPESFLLYKKLVVFTDLILTLSKKYFCSVLFVITRENALKASLASIFTVSTAFQFKLAAQPGTSLRFFAHLRKDKQYMKNKVNILKQKMYMFVNESYIHNSAKSYGHNSQEK